MSVLDELLADLRAEGDQLRAAVAPLDDDGWRMPTPADGWDVAAQIAHLAWTDEAAVLAATDEERWDEIVLQAIDDPTGFIDKAALAGAAEPPVQVLARWDTARTRLAEVLRHHEGRLPWFGPPMSPASMATARLMETWAHSLDVHDALDVTAERTDRVRHVCHLGVRTRDFAYSVHSAEPPAEQFRVELTLPSGALFTAGPVDAAQRVTGSAWDFARLVTQRTHRDDTDLVADGEDAAYWLSIAQAFAGPPGTGRSKRG